jgi:hypothetical protein
MLYTLYVGTIEANVGKTLPVRTNIGTKMPTIQLDKIRSETVDALWRNGSDPMK